MSEFILNALLKHHVRGRKGLRMFDTYSGSTGSSLSFLTIAFWGKRTLLEHTHTNSFSHNNVIHKCPKWIWSENTYHFIGHLSLEGNKSEKGEFTRENLQEL